MSSSSAGNAGLQPGSVPSFFFPSGQERSKKRGRGEAEEKEPGWSPAFPAERG
jgi:hypothetical protein